MSTSDKTDTNAGAAEIYREHREAVDRLADRDDKTAVVFQAIKNLVGDDDE